MDRKYNCNGYEGRVGLPVVELTKKEDKDKLLKLYTQILLSDEDNIRLNGFVDYYVAEIKKELEGEEPMFIGLATDNFLTTLYNALGITK